MVKEILCQITGEGCANLARGGFLGIGRERQCDKCEPVARPILLEVQKVATEKDLSHPRASYSIMSEASGVMTLRIDRGTMVASIYKGIYASNEVDLSELGPNGKGVLNLRGGGEGN